MPNINLHYQFLCVPKNMRSKSHSRYDYDKRATIHLTLIELEAIYKHDKNTYVHDYNFSSPNLDTALQLRKQIDHIIGTNPNPQVPFIFNTTQE